MPEVERHRISPLAACGVWPCFCHFPFAFSPSAFLEPASPMPKLVARLRIPAAVRFSRTAIAAEFSPDAARARNRSSSLEVQVERLPIISLPSARVQPRRAVLSNPKLRASEIFPTRALPEKPSLITLFMEYRSEVTRLDLARKLADEQDWLDG